MASRVSLSMLVTLELRERLNELSLLSSGIEPRGGHTESRTVGEKQEEVKLPVHKYFINYLQIDCSFSMRVYEFLRLDVGISS